MPSVPGGSNFRDVTSVFASASKEMEPGSIMAVETFSLSDAMSAIEIGEPRLDTGMQLDTVARPQFDPLTALLPEEICWIIDRSMAYETEWHASNPLAHTIFTMLHIHYVNDIDPDVLPYLSAINLDPLRPLELITVVLRAYTSGLLKSCNLVWTELSKGTLIDTEDWQSDRSEISLLEGWPVKAAIARLDAAIAWLSSTARVSPLWQAALTTRLQFRRVILLLMNSANSLHREPGEFDQLVTLARQLLAIIQANPSQQPPLSSPAHAAFDPYIARKLHTFLPVRVITVPSPAQTLDAYDRLLDGWEELARLSKTYHITTWDLLGCYRSWSSSLTAQPAYIRSCTQTIFYDGIQVLNSLPQGWVVNCLFQETLGSPYSTFARHWGGQGSASLAQLEKAVIHTLIPHIRNHWNNPSRRRRFLAKSILDWHLMYDEMCSLIEGLDTSHMVPSTFHQINQFPKAVVIWRLASIREVILSGFQLELYHNMERPFAYWFAAQVIGVQLRELDALLNGKVEGIVPPDSPSRREMQYQLAFLTAFQAMAMAMFATLVCSLPQQAIFNQWEHLRPNLRRRYKWAFNPAYEECEFQPAVLAPDFVQYLRAVQEVYDHVDEKKEEQTETADHSVQESSFRSPSAHFEHALNVLQLLVSSANTGALEGSWAGDRMKLTRGMMDTCQELRTFLFGPPSTSSTTGPGDISQNPSLSVSVSELDWTRSFDNKPKTPWFPSVRRSSEDGGG